MSEIIEMSGDPPSESNTELSVDEILIVGEGRSSNAAKDVEAVITSTMLVRLFTWIAGVWLGLSILGWFIDMNRFWWMTIVLVPAFLWFLMGIAAIDPLSMGIFIAIEAGCFVLSLAFTLWVIASFWNCAFAGSECPATDSSSGQLARVVEAGFYLVFTVQCGKACNKFHALSGMYSTGDDEVIRKYRNMVNIKKKRRRV